MGFDGESGLVAGRLWWSLRSLGCLAFLTAIGVIFYWPGLRTHYFEDDYQFFFSPPPDILYFFSHKNPYNNVPYRPLEATALVLVQKYFGSETWPIHLTAVVLNALLAWVVLGVGLRIGYSRVQSVLASGFMLLAQINCHAVLSNDTLSQVSGALFGSISVWALYSSQTLAAPVAGGARKSGGEPWGWSTSVLLFTFALFSKETSASFLLMIIGVAFMVTRRRMAGWAALRRAAALSLPYLVVMLIYFVTRLYVGVARPGFGSGNYEFTLGANILKNIFLFTCCAMTPISTVTVASAVQTHAYGTLLAAAAAGGLFVLILIVGIWLSEKKMTNSVLCACTVAALFPAVMMNHVSELYLYNAMPFLSLIVGAALGKLLESVPRKSIRFAGLLVLILALFASNIVGIQQKAALMRANGERATELLSQVVTLIPEVPKGGELVLLNPPGQYVRYSTFLLPNFHVLNYGLHRIHQLGERNDFTIKVADYAELHSLRSDSKRLILTLRNDRVTVFQEPADARSESK